MAPDQVVRLIQSAVGQGRSGSSRTDQCGAGWRRQCGVHEDQFSRGACRSVRHCLRRTRRRQRPVPGASVTVFTDQALTNPLPLQSDLGFRQTPRTQIHSQRQPRSLQFRFEPVADRLSRSARKVFCQRQGRGLHSAADRNQRPRRRSRLLSITERALDGQPIAVAGGFTLTREDVAIENLGDRFQHSCL